MCDVTDRKRMSLQAVTLFRKCLRSAAAQRAFTVVGNVDCTLSHAQATQNDAEAVGPEPAMSGKMLDKNTSKWAVLHDNDKLSGVRQKRHSHGDVQTA